MSTRPSQQPLRRVSTNSKISTSNTNIGRVVRPPPTRILQPPFPNGVCGGTVITIPPEDTFGVDVNLANINLGGNLILPPRPVKVWLPPGYDKQQQQQQLRHPVLYTHDGENTMEDTDSWTGASWRMAGALTRMKEYGMIDNTPLPIIVMIPSKPGDLIPGVRRRHLEYGDYHFPFAQAHVDFVAKTLKPYIDNRFHTNPSPEATYTIGSSLGGQASLHLLLRYPDLFGGAACLSPAFGPAMYDQVKKMGPKILRNKKIYLDIGGDMDDVKVPFLDVFDHMTPEHWWNPGYFWLDTQLQMGVTQMRDTLQKAGVDHAYQRYPGGRHNERAWAQRIHKPLLYLYQ